mgnify:FL=1
MMKRAATTVFGEWAALGKDEKMAHGHESAVKNMLEAVLKNHTAYRFIDAGCGNGWVVRMVKQLKDCSAALGVDGSKKMVEKAQRIDPKGTYLHADLMTWIPHEKVDVVHAMEVVYYLNNPKAFIKAVYANWLNKNGQLVIGIDFYIENTVSHSWPEDCGITKMRLFSEKEWVSFFNAAGFRSVTSWRVDPKEGWAGTLVVTGTV